MLVSRILADGDRSQDLSQTLRSLARHRVADPAPVDLDQRHDLHRISAQQRLVAHIQLRAVDRTLDDRFTQLAPDQRDHLLQRRPLEDVVGHGRRDPFVPSSQDDVRCRRLGDAPVGREHDRLLETCTDCIRLREPRIHIAADDLRPHWHALVGDPPPRADGGVHAVGSAERSRQVDDVDRQPSLDVVHAHVQRLTREEEQRPDVDVRANVVSPEQLQSRLDELVRRQQERQAEGIGRPAEALVLRERVQDVQLLFRLAPRGAQPLERSCAVRDHVRPDAQAGVVAMHELAVHEDQVVSVCHLAGIVATRCVEIK